MIKMILLVILLILRVVIIILNKPNLTYVKSCGTKLTIDNQKSTNKQSELNWSLG